MVFLLFYGIVGLIAAVSYKYNPFQRLESDSIESKIASSVLAALQPRFDSIESSVLAALQPRLESIESRLESKIASSVLEALQPRFDSIESSVLEALQPRFDSIESRLETLKDVESSLTGLIDFFHNFPTRKLGVVMNCTQLVNACETQYGTQYGTAHAVLYKDRYALLTVSHFGCGGIAPQNWIYSPHADLALIRDCPKNGYVMNVMNAFASLQITDEVMAYGKAVVQEPTHTKDVRIVDRAWMGHIAGYYGLNIKAHPFTGNSTFLSTECVTNAEQEGAMSGAAALNGCGYLGLVHGTKLYNSQAIVLPYTEIFQFLEANLDQLMTPEECPGVKVLEIPLAYGKWCNRPF